MIRCRKCGRQLKTEKSILRGCGPTCGWVDKKQITLNFGGNDDSITEIGSERNERQNIPERQLYLPTMRKIGL